jgi:hypothetical protein
MPEKNGENGGVKKRGEMRKMLMGKQRVGWVGPQSDSASSP